jgi:hypothetical protein
LEFKRFDWDKHLKYSERLKQYIGSVGYSSYSEGFYTFGLGEDLPSWKSTIIEVGDDYIVVKDEHNSASTGEVTHSIIPINIFVIYSKSG